MNLLLDIGNSRLKWACSDGLHLTHHGAVVRDEQLFLALTEMWRVLPKPHAIVAANVVGDEFAQQLSRFIYELWSLNVEYAAVTQGHLGLVVAYPQPELFGVDRWLGLIAARHLYKGAVCVIGCGTAVTIDVVDENGTHLGGVIAPGTGLMQQALVFRTEGVRRGVAASSKTASRVLGCDTQTGVERGALYAVAGLIIHTYEVVKIESNTPLTPIVTGGDAERVLDQIGGEYHHSPCLVLHGLQILFGR